MTTHFPPPCVPLAHADATLARQGFALLDAASVQQWLDVPAQELAALAPSWGKPGTDHVFPPFPSLVPRPEGQPGRPKTEA